MKLLIVKLSSFLIYEYLYPRGSCSQILKFVEFGQFNETLLLWLSYEFRCWWCQKCCNLTTFTSFHQYWNGKDKSCEIIKKWINKRERCNTYLVMVWWQPQSIDRLKYERKTGAFSQHSDFISCRTDDAGRCYQMR